MRRPKPDAFPDTRPLSVPPAEREWLQMVRLQCAIYEFGHRERVDAAHQHAGQCYGPDLGPVVASRVAALIRAMRVERREPFTYLSPTCSSCSRKITVEEWQLLSLMRCASRGDCSGAAVAAAELAGGVAAPRLAAAAARFGAAVSGVISCPAAMGGDPQRLH